MHLRVSTVCFPTNRPFCGCVPGRATAIFEWLRRGAKFIRGWCNQLGSKRVLRGSVSAKERRERKVALLRRIMLVLSVAAIMAAMLAASAMPAFADNTGEQKGPGQNGPPLGSGDLDPLDNSNGAVVVHCAALGELIGQDLKGSRVLTPNGDIRGGGCRPA